MYKRGGELEKTAVMKRKREVKRIIGKMVVAKTKMLSK